MRTKQAANFNLSVDVRELREINTEEEGSVQVYGAITGFVNRRNNIRGSKKIGNFFIS